MPILSSHVVDIGVSPQSSQWCDALLEQVARGDQHAFEQLFDHLAPQALGLATRIIHDHAQAEEVVQEVFVEVWRKAPQFDATLGGARSWVLRLTRMRSIDRLRSFIASHDREEKDATQRAASWSLSVEDEAVSAVENAELRRIVDDIGEPHTTAIVLAFFAGLTHSELAEATGVPLGTAKTRVRDGLRKLKTLLDGKGVTHYDPR